MTKIGVVLCTCGQEIEKYIEVARVVESLRDEVKVSVLSRVCAPEGKKQLGDFLRDNAIKALAVAACPARFASPALESVCLDAGLQSSGCTVIDWREGCAWAHSDQMREATSKAIDLVRMGIVQVNGAQPTATRREPIVPRVLVIGGGIAGMAAAQELASQEVPVTLVERAPQLGGRLRDLPLNGSAQVYAELVRSTSNHPLITLQLDTHIRSAHSTAGNFCVTLADGSLTDTQITAGAIIIATGATELRPIGSLCYDGRRVLTVHEFQTELASGKPVPPRLVYVLCADSRNAKIPYCSLVCCIGAISQAVRIKQAHPETEITLLYRDLYLPNVSAEESVREAKRAGIQFVHYEPDHLHVEQHRARVGDNSTGMPMDIGYDRLVLAPPLVPDPSAGQVAQTFGLMRDSDGFFIEPRWRLSRERAMEHGIFVCGAAHGPVDFDMAVMQGIIAAKRAARRIRKGTRQVPLWSASTKDELCTGCAQCVQVCPSGAIHLNAVPSTGGVRSNIDPFRCLGCGSCLVACPSKAISMPQSTDLQLLAQIDAALTRNGDARPHSLIFACHWSGFAAMELAGARRMQYSVNVRVIELPCSARLDPRHVLYAFLNGAERVTLALCPPGECHFGNGNTQAASRIQALRLQMSAWGFDRERLQVLRLKGDDAETWVKVTKAADQPVFHSML